MSSSGQKSSSVAQRCNLLSQFFKENGRFANKGVETMNLLPNLENSDEISRQDVRANDSFSNSKNGVVLEQGSSELTILYGGQVFVFNDISAEKAKEIMDLANKAAASSHHNVTPDLNMASTSIATSQAVPIARRASLHRFFEKRKDRATARAPYQVNIPFSMAAAAAKPDDQSNKYSWMEFEAQSSLKRLDLNL